MNSIVKIVPTFEYLINGWRIELFYSDGSSIDCSDTEFDENKNKLLTYCLSDLSADWIPFNDEDEIDIDEDEIAAYVDFDEIEEYLFNYFKLNDSVSINLRFSDDS